MQERTTLCATGRSLYVGGTTFLNRLFKVAALTKEEYRQFVAVHRWIFPNIWTAYHSRLPNGMGTGTTYFFCWLWYRSEICDLSPAVSTFGTGPFGTSLLARALDHMSR